MTFVDAVAERYGNPKVRWAAGRLRPGQRVRIVVKDAQYGDRIADAIATGRRSKKKNIIRYKDRNGRTWMLSMDNEDIQVMW